MQRLPLGAGSLLGTTLAAQIMTLPVIALNFHRISLISLPANLLVQPAILPAHDCGRVLVAFAGLTGQAIVRVLGWIALVDRLLHGRRHTPAWGAAPGLR